LIATRASRVQWRWLVALRLPPLATYVSVLLVNIGDHIRLNEDVGELVVHG
jgi:hypothetical protein